MEQQVQVIVRCDECEAAQRDATNVVKAGFVWRKRRQVQRYRCKTCGKVFAPPDESEKCGLPPAGE